MKTTKALLNLIIMVVGFLLVPFGVMPLIYDTTPQARGIKMTRPRGGVGARLTVRRKWYDGTPMTREQFAAVTNLGLVLRSVFLDQITAIADTAQNDLMQLFNVQNSTRAVERNQGMGGFGDVPEHTGAIEYDSFDLLFQKTYEHKEYAQGLAVERKLIDDDEYGAIRRRAEMLGLAFDRTVYKHAAGVFNNAFSTTVLGGDSQPLCDTDHPYSPNDSSTQGNKGSEALSHDAVIETAISMMQFNDSRGNNLNIMPDTLLVPVSLLPAAQVIVGSGQKSGSANNDVNVNQTYRVIGSRYLNDANNWFLIDSRMAKSFLNFFWRVRPEFTNDANSDYNLVSRYRGYMRYSFGFDHWAWIYGHEVS